MQIEFSNVTREYGAGDRKLKAVDGVSFGIDAGEFVVILGHSGAGKSTLLNLLGGMDTATGGEITVNGRVISNLNDNALADYRAETIGFVFQFYNLIPTLTALENVALTRSIVRSPLDAAGALAMVDLGEHAGQFPAQLSGGEQQRVSIARAIAKNPDILLCDEPTGALDSDTGIIILEMLHKLCREQRKTVIIVTHNAVLAECADRVIRMRNGKIRDIAVNAEPKAIREVTW
ncbi:MAG: ABC transporter ATP-binding protein [Oscillospiraceae bacterium]|jgi:putative ABC transport system ATP-binding protein|nr:ABC transporter ATP-binding protein [Oscillospiraceae bacterium]